jgi:hypothetical protein
LFPVFCIRVLSKYATAYVEWQALQTWVLALSVATPLAGEVRKVAVPLAWVVVGVLPYAVWHPDAVPSEQFPAGLKTAIPPGPRALAPVLSRWTAWFP